MLAMGAFALILPWVIGACSASAPLEDLCQAAARLAAANVDISDALTGMDRSDAGLYSRSITFAQAEVDAASSLARRVPDAPPGLQPGTVSALTDALNATSSLIADLPPRDSSDVPALRMRVDDAQLALASNPGLSDACTEPIKPAIE